MASLLSFPTNPADFDSDERISFSRLDNKFIGVHDDGTEFEFDRELKRWIPTIDEEELEQQRLAYGGSADDDIDTSNGSNKRKKEGEAGAPRSKKMKPPPQPRQNTAIYVTGLPLDATVDEVQEVFSRKCGVIAEEIDSGRPRIKLYSDEDGNFKGDALVVFFKPQSVEMAIMLLDDTDFRFSASGLSSGRMKVQAAESSYKKTQHEVGEGGAAAPAAAAAIKPKDHRSREQDKKKIIKRTQKLDAKLADWDDDEPFGAQPEARRDKTVILRHMFTLKELEDDPGAIQDIEEDIREECEKLGALTKVILYDLEEDGIVFVKFKTPEAAEACIELMHGRAFDGRTVQAHFATGKERFRKSEKESEA
jgi:HIV Tat-specific factor 1